MKIKKGWYIVFVAPLMIMFSIIQLIPFFTGLAYSFVDWNGLSKSPKVFVGIQNYIKIFSDSNFIDSIIRTTIFTLITVVLVNVLAMAFAVIVTTRIKTRNLARTMLFMPYLIGGLILGYIWSFVLGDYFAAGAPERKIVPLRRISLANHRFAFELHRAIVKPCF